MPAQALAAICGIAGVLGLAAGAWLLLASEKSQPGHPALQRWLFELNLMALLDRNRRIERRLYRHHRVFGATVVVGAVALLAALWLLHSHPAATELLEDNLGAWGAWALILTSWTLAALTLGAGVFLFRRPSALKGVETAANRWIEAMPMTTRITVSAERPVTRLLLGSPRVAGILLLLAGSGCLLAFSTSF
jgi:hypothetical protein